MGKSYSSPSSMPSTSDEGLQHDIWMLGDIPSVLDDAERKAVHSNSGKLYIKELRQIAYDAEDALQDYEIQGTCEQCRKSKRLRQEVRIAAPRPSTPCLHCRAKDKIRSIRKSYSDLQKTRKSLGLDDEPRQRGQVHGATRQSTGSIPNQKELYSMKKYKDRIVQRLSDGGSSLDDLIDDECKGAMFKNLTILPIAGVGGGGKTTLVQHIFNDKEIQEKFKLRSWVSATNCQAGDPLYLMKSVLESIDRSGDGRTPTQLSPVQALLLTKLKGKKFLLVVDDAYSKDHDFWSTFWTPIVQSVAEGSIALVTLREYEVIPAMPPHVRRTGLCSLLPLPFEDCWSLFQSSIQSEILQDEDIVQIGIQIVRKYEGIPLAIKHAADSLWREDDVSRWEEFLKNASLDSYWEASYRALEPQLKRCFLYCALFPKGYLFAKDYLIKLWMSEGFIKPRKGKRLEAVGDEYFTGLLHKFLMLHDWQNDEKYVMPGPVHDLAESILDHNFCRLEDRKIGKIDMEPVRHASFVVHKPQEEEVIFKIQNPKLRTFLVVNKMNFALQLKLEDDAFSNFGYMRTLDLSYTDIAVLPSSIKHLRSLRFLGLNSCRKLQALPESFGELISLQHLYLDELTSFCMPAGISKLTSLETLPIFKVGRKNDDARIQELGQLVNLRGTLSIMGLCNVISEGLPSQILGNLEFLRELTLCWSSDWDGSNDQSSSYHQKPNEANEEDDKQMKQVFGNLKPHANLQNLYIQSYGGKEFPEWLGDRSFKKLKFVMLDNCKNCDALPSLGNLPSLKNLSIRSVGVSQINSQFGMFSSLETLAFSEMYKWKEWFADAKAFPKLELLELLSCPRLMGVPLISSLKTLKMETCGSVTEVPLLPSLRVIKMKNCSRIVELPAFPCLETLKILNCEGLTAIPSLSSLQNMHIRGADKLDNLPVPKGLRKLILGSYMATIKWDESYSFKDGGNHTASTSHGLEELEVFKCDNLGSIPIITSLLSLKIEGCEKMIDLSSFPSLESLCICDCDYDELWKLPTLESLECLSLMYCERLERICYQPKLQYLWVESCNQLQYVDQTASEGVQSPPDIGMLASLDSLFIANCNKIAHCIPAIPKLVIDQYTFSFEEDEET